MSKQEEIQEGYKVVTVTKNKKLTGAIICLDDIGDSAGAVHYSVRQWTYPKSHCGPLAVFENEGQAQEFINRNVPITGRIYKCQFVESAVERLYRRICGGQSVRDSWLPAGTIFAKKVKLIKQVKKT